MSKFIEVTHVHIYYDSAAQKSVVGNETKLLLNVDAIDSIEPCEGELASVRIRLKSDITQSWYVKDEYESFKGRLL